MLKKLESFITLSMVFSITCTLLGAILIIFPGFSMYVFSYLIAIFLIVAGLAMLIKFNDKLFLVDYMSIGILAIVLGVVILYYQDTVTLIVPIIIGIWIVTNSIFKMKLAFILKEYGTNDTWFISFLLAILTMICGLALLVNPEIGSLAITTFIGILLVIYSISALANMIIFKKKINIIAKYLK